MKQKVDHPKICAIVVAWKSASCIAKCLQSLEKSSIPLDIIAIDNNSDDGVKAIIDQFPNVTYCNSGGNLGYAGGNNVGLKMAEERGADFIFILNPDAYIAPDCVPTLLKAMQEDEKIAIACPKIYYAESQTLWFAGATLDLKTGQSPHIGQNEKDGPAFANDNDLPRANGCAMLIRKQAMQKVGHMNDAYFLYFEEIDWSLHFLKAGYRIRFVASAHCWHAASTTTGGFFSPLYQYYNTRNSLYLIRIFGTGPWRSFLVHHAMGSLRRLLNVVRNRPQKALPVLRAIMLGYFDYARHRMGRRPF